MNIAVDFGNTFSKLGVFENNNLKEQSGKLDDDKIIDYIYNKKPEHVIVGSVSKDAFFIKKACEAKNINCLLVDQLTKLPINNTYQTKGTLGADRIAAVAGAAGKFPQKNCLAIDMGTCITYDLIDRNGNYLGGSISPGINLKLKALNTFTARLPLVEIATKVSADPDNKSANNVVELTGRTTRESILSGIIHGTASEIEGMIGKYADKMKDLKVVICGGDAKFFESRIKAHIFVIPELVLMGLNRILQYNVSNN